MMLMVRGKDDEVRMQVFERALDRWTSSLSTKDQSTHNETYLRLVK